VPGARSRWPPAVFGPPTQSRPPAAQIRRATDEATTRAALGQGDGRPARRAVTENDQRHTAHRAATKQPGIPSAISPSRPENPHYSTLMAGLSTGAGLRFREIRNEASKRFRGDDHQAQATEDRKETEIRFRRRSYLAASMAYWSPTAHCLACPQKAVYRHDPIVQLNAPGQPPR